MMRVSLLRRTVPRALLYETSPALPPTRLFLCVCSNTGANSGLRTRQKSTTATPPSSNTTCDQNSVSNITAKSPFKVRYMPERPKRVVVGITGATGTPYAIRLLEILRDLGVETHLVMSKWALATLKYETPLSESAIRALAHTNYTGKDMSAPIASGSFQHDGMVIVPCSMKTLAAIRAGFGDDLISRAADVTLKEGRRLTLAVRETPLNDIHLDNMLFLRRAGAIIFPPVPAFYTRPKSLEDMIDQSVGRMLDAMGFCVDGFERWDGFRRY
jgi:4-hydroxy-3-polyprenylbenzoate decarboxylase